jgi:pimeloyl-ACP methyl ester carboxylesterase
VLLEELSAAAYFYEQLQFAQVRCSTIEVSVLESLQSRLVGGTSVRFEQRGHGPAMVLIHGLLGNSFNWRRVLDRFSELREVFALDMPGAGFSEYSPALDARLSAAAERLLAFLDVLGIKTCDLVGSSYGGTTAWMLAARHPERVRTLTLVSPANPWSRIGRKRLALLNIPGIGRLFPPMARLMTPLHRIFVKRMYGDRSRVTEETLRGYSLPLLRKGALDHAVKIARNWQFDMSELQQVLWKAANIPTLIVWGSKDRVVDPASAEILSRYFKQSRLVIMEGAGHLPYEECPEEFASIVGSFLEEYSPAQVLDGK